MRPRPVLASRTALWLFLVALVVRIVYTLLRDVGSPLPFGSDAISYDAFARAILSGTGWIAHPGPGLFRPPGYPMVLAALYAVTGRHLEIVQLLQSIVGATSVVLVYEVGRRHFGQVPALLAALWLLVNPLHLDFNGKLLRETWLVLLNVALIASLLSATATRFKGILLTAALFTVLIHFDSRYLFHFPFFAVYYLIVAGDGRPFAGDSRSSPAGNSRSSRDSRSSGDSRSSSAKIYSRETNSHRQVTRRGYRFAFRSAARATALFGILVVILSAPWGVRNAIAYDRFVLIDTRALDRWGKRAQSSVLGERPGNAAEGSSGDNEAATPGGSSAATPGGSPAATPGYTADDTAGRRPGVPPGLTDLRSFELAKEARFDSLPAQEKSAFRAGVRPRSGQPAKALFNLVEFWRIVHLKPEYRPLPDGRFAEPWSAEHNVSSFVFMGLLVPGFLFGAWRALASGHRAGVLCLAFIAVHTLLHVIVHSVVRYRLPIEPLYAWIAFRGMAEWMPRKHRAPIREKSKEPAVEVPV